MLREPFEPLFKKADDEEDSLGLSFSDYGGAAGAETGLIGGAISGGLAGHQIRNRNYIIKADDGIKLRIPSNPKKGAAIGALAGGLAGLSSGYALGGGLGALLDGHSIRKHEREQDIQMLKEEVRNRMDEARLNREASSNNLNARLSKTAGILNNIRLATGMGKEVRGAKKTYNELNNMDAFTSAKDIPAYFSDMEDATIRKTVEEARVREARNDLKGPAAVTGALGAVVGAAALQQKAINDRVFEELRNERQGAGSVSDAPAGMDVTASPSPLFQSIEKTAGPLNFVKNLTGMNVSKAKKNIENIQKVPSDLQKRLEYTREAAKGLKDAQVDKNRARLGAGTALVAGGGALGGINAYQNSKKPVVDETMTNQYPSYTEQKIAYDSIMSRLEKTAGIRDVGGRALDALKSGGQNALGGARNLGENALEGVRNYGANVSGQDYRNARDLYAAGELGENTKNEALKRMLIAQGATGAGLGAAGAGAYALANRGGDDEGEVEDEGEEQIAFEALVDRLEKTAAFNPRSAASQFGRKVKDLGGRTVDGARDLGGRAADGARDLGGRSQAALNNFGQDVSGRKYRLAKSVRNDDPVAVPRSELLDVRNQMLKAQGIAGAGVAGAAGLGYGAHALANRGDDDEERVAFEALVNRLEKTAAYDPRLAASLAAAQVGQNVKNMGGRVAEGARSLGQKATDLGSRAVEGTLDLGSRAVEGTRNLGSRAIEGTRNLGEATIPAVRNYGNTVSGRDYRRTSAGNHTGVFDDETKRDALKDMLVAQGVTGAAIGAAGAGGYALANRGGDDEEEQVAYEQLMSRLEKTAAPGLNAIKSFANKSKSTFKDLKGTNHANAVKKEKDLWSNPGNTTVGDFEKKYTNFAKNTSNQQEKMEATRSGAALGGAAGLAAGTAAGAGAVAGINALRNDDKEKTASEVVNGLFKEAASAIIDENLPPVRQHVDPMNKITFSR